MCSPRSPLCCHATYQVSRLCDAPAHNTDHQRHPAPHQTQYHAHHFCHYQMAIPSQLLQARDTILYDTQNQLRHPKNKVQQTRLLHLAKGRKVTRKVICDAVGIYYATTTGNSEAAAEWVKDLVVAGSLIWLLTTVSRLISRFTFPRPMVANHVSPQPDMKPGDTTDIQEIDEANVSDLNAHDGLIEEIHDVFKAPEPE